MVDTERRATNCTHAHDISEIGSEALIEPLASDSTKPRFNKAKSANCCSGMLPASEKTVLSWIL